MPSSTPPTLTLGQHVVVRLDGAPAVPATVVAAEGSRLTLVRAVLDEGTPPTPGAEVKIEWTAGADVRRYAGCVVQARERHEELRVELTGSVDVESRRRWSRVDAVLRVEVAGVDEPGVGGPTETVNVSAGGVLLHDRWSLRVGSDVWLDLDLDDGGAPVRVLGQIVRKAPVALKGVRFDDVSAADRERLVRFVAECERELTELRLA
jgi:PilZ domain